MKQLHYSISFLLLLFSLGCSTATQPIYDIDMCVITDVTDSLSAKPTAEEITQPLGLQQNPWQSVRILCTTVSDRQINDVRIVTLKAEPEWSGNVTLRQATVAHFVKQVQQALYAMKYTASRPYSIIFPAVAQEANLLANSTAIKRYILLYSDLLEHTPAINFYDLKTVNRLQKSSQSIAQQLEETTPLKQLNGLELWLLYNPQNYKQNRSYMSITELYQHLFTAHGATVHIANKFQPL